MNVNKKDVIKRYNKLVDKCETELGTNCFKIADFAITNTATLTTFHNQAEIMEQLLKAKKRKK